MILARRLLGAIALLLVSPGLAGAQVTYGFDPSLEGTFSIIGRDSTTGELGMAVQSRTIAVGSRTRGGRGGLAIFAHQAASNPMYSRMGIELLENGMTPQQALDFMLRADNGGANRQVAILDIHGRTAVHTGTGTSDWKGHKCGVNFCAQGNTLTGAEVVDAMARTFEATKGSLAERLLTALEAGQAAGGDRRGQQSAAMLILKPLTLAGFSDVSLDLRVDEHATPIAELRRIFVLSRAR